MPFLEKYFDLTLEGTEQDINKYLAKGWYIDYRGTTLVIMRKDIEGDGVIDGQSVADI